MLWGSPSAAIHVTNITSPPNFRTSLPTHGAAKPLSRCITIPLKELQVDYLDYMLLHGIGMGGMEAYENRYIKNGILDFLLEERKVGRIRNLGFSYHGDIEVFDYLLSKHDEYQWDFVQIQLNYLDWKHAKEINPRNTDAEYLYGELQKRGIPCHHHGATSEDGFRTCTTISSPA